MIPWWGWLIIACAGFTAFVYVIYILCVVVFFKFVKALFKD